MSDASDMLAAALEQMDGIIAGTHTHSLSTMYPVLCPLCSYFSFLTLSNALRTPTQFSPLLCFSKSTSYSDVTLQNVKSVTFFCRLLMELQI